MAKLIKGNTYNIQGVKGETYNDCKLTFGTYQITAVDGQYFQIVFEENGSELNEVWWDSEGFKFKKIK